MAVPKRMMSRSNTRSRRAQWKATAVDLAPITHRGQRYLVPRRLVKAVQTGLADPSTLIWPPSTGVPR